MTVRIIQIAIPFIWLGMIGAISFIEAPLKFQAPGITLPLGLGIGRLVFQMLNRCEIAFAVIFAVTMILERKRRVSSLVVFFLISAILLLQTVWLLPVLDARAESVIQGIQTAGSGEHIIYIVFEIAKFLMLFVLGILVGRKISENKNA